MPNDLHAMVIPASAQPTPQPEGPCAMAIFGAGGDLIGRLVIPALCNLMANRLLPDEFVLIGMDMAAPSTNGGSEYRAARSTFAPLNDVVGRSSPHGDDIDICLVMSGSVSISQMMEALQQAFRRVSTHIPAFCRELRKRSCRRLGFMSLPGHTAKT